MALIADTKATDEPKKGRILRRQKQTDALDILAESSSLYGAGTDDSVRILTKKFFLFERVFLESRFLKVGDHCNSKTAHTIYLKFNTSLIHEKRGLNENKASDGKSS